MRFRHMFEREQHFVINSFFIDEINVYRQIILTIKRRSTIHKQRNLCIIIRKSVQQLRLYFFATKHKMIFNDERRREFYIVIETSKSSLKLNI
jgi:hypothetical protein